MSSRDKKIWKKPELTSFANAADAIAEFLAHGKPDHAAAIERMSDEARDWKATQATRNRKAGHR